MAEEHEQQTVARDIEKGRDGGSLSHTVTISAELYEKVHHILTRERLLIFVALSQSQKYRRRRPPSTFRKSYSPGIIWVTITNAIVI